MSVVLTFREDWFAHSPTTNPLRLRGHLLWNGLDDNNRRVRIGMYIILFEALDSSGGVVHAMKDVAVVATKL